MGVEQLSTMDAQALKRHLQFFFEEDDLARNFHYTHSLPQAPVMAHLKFKSNMTIAGLPFFVEALRFLGAEFPPKVLAQLLAMEGQKVKKGTDSIEFELPFNIALTGERIALNLLQRASSIATFAAEHAALVKRSKLDIKVLDTRKTTPGLRFLEKYAVRVGGGFNHRFGQADTWMVKDNHKAFFGGVGQALGFFREQGSFYAGIVVEVHSLDEMLEAQALGVRHMLLDNFSPAQVKKAVKLKAAGTTIEVSGGVSLDNIEKYLVPGVDAISIGRLTYAAPPVDISFKYAKAGKR